jgi:predicted PurR-regulated permease PerM
MQPTLAHEIKTILINYFKTQFVLMLIVTAIVWGGLYLINLKYALLLAFGAGALSVIPLFGMTLASIIISLVAIFDQSTFLPDTPPFFEGLVIFLVFLVINFLIDYLLTPHILSKTTKINPVVLLLTVFLGTVFFNFIGAFLAIPALLTIKTMWNYLKERKTL